MTMNIDNIKASAVAYGACDKIDGTHTAEQLARLFFSPQGLEFAAKRRFPTLDILRSAKTEIEPLGIYVDAGAVEIPSAENICVAGKTSATIKASGVQYIHTVVVMHGAAVNIEATNYAVLNVENIGGGEVKINKDKTVIVL